MSRFGSTLLYRLPGPMTIMSASRMRSSASGLARTSAGSMKTRVDAAPSARLIADLAVEMATGDEPGREVERHARRRQYLAANREDAV